MMLINIAIKSLMFKNKLNLTIIINSEILLLSLYPEKRRISLIHFNRISLIFKTLITGLNDVETFFHEYANLIYLKSQMEINANRISKV